MPKVVVHGPGTGSEGGTPAQTEEDRVPLSGDEGSSPGVVSRGVGTSTRRPRVPDPRPTAPEAGPFLRCNNCGVLGHLPKACPNYGWYFPAPGKTREDYVVDRQRVQDLIASDIISEHEVHEDDLEDFVFLGARPTKARKMAALQLTCEGCGQPPGERCRTGAGKVTEPHKIRLDSLDSPGVGS